MQMEAWELDFEWLRTRHMVKDRFGTSSIPDLQTILFLIGIQEVGEFRAEFTKEEKQDLIHVAVCTLLEPIGYFSFTGRDHEGWPHWEETKKFTVKGVDAQERLLKEQIIQFLQGAITEEE